MGQGQSFCLLGTISFIYSFTVTVAQTQANQHENIQNFLKATCKSIGKETQSHQHNQTI